MCGFHFQMIKTKEQSKLGGKDFCKEEEDKWFSVNLPAMIRFSAWLSLMTAFSQPSRGFPFSQSTAATIPFYLVLDNDPGVLDGVNRGIPYFFRGVFFLSPQLVPIRSKDTIEVFPNISVIFFP